MSIPPPSSLKFNATPLLEQVLQTMEQISPESDHSQQSNEDRFANVEKAASMVQQLYQQTKVHIDKDPEIFRFKNEERKVKDLKESLIDKFEGIVVSASGKYYVINFEQDKCQISKESPDRGDPVDISFEDIPEADRPNILAQAETKFHENLTAIFERLETAHDKPLSSSSSTPEDSEDEDPRAGTSRDPNDPPPLSRSLLDSIHDSGLSDHESDVDSSDGRPEEDPLTTETDEKTLTAKVLKKLQDRKDHYKALSRRLLGQFQAAKQEALSAQQAKEQEIQSLKAEIEKKTKTLKSQLKLVEGSEEKAEKAEAELSNLKAQLATAQTQLKEANTHRKDLEENLAARRAEYEQMETNLKQAQAELEAAEQAVKQLSSQLAELKTIREEEKSSLGELRQAIVKLGSDCELLVKQANDSREELNSVQEANTDLTQQNTDLTQVNAKLLKDRKFTLGAGIVCGALVSAIALSALGMILYTTFTGESIMIGEFNSAEQLASVFNEYGAIGAGALSAIGLSIFGISFYRYRHLNTRKINPK